MMDIAKNLAFWVRPEQPAQLPLFGEQLVEAWASTIEPTDLDLTWQGDGDFITVSRWN